MSIYAVGDLHLSASGEKPMDIFGGEWIRHAERLEEAWRREIREEDTVILAGDLSWSLKMDGAQEDLHWIAALPGTKILIRGNHDLWWQSIGRLNDFDSRMHFVQNSCFMAEGIAVCGSRGWICPGDVDFSAHDEKIYRRELMRLRLSLEAAEKAGAPMKIMALHFPPTNDRKEPSGFTELAEEFGVSQVVYGHLHGQEAWIKGLQGSFHGVAYHLVSLDYLRCMPKKIVAGGAREEDKE